MPRPPSPASVIPCEAFGAATLQVVRFKCYENNEILAAIKLLDDDASGGICSFTPAMYLCASDAEKMTPSEIWSQIKWDAQGSSNDVMELQLGYSIPVEPPSRFDFADACTGWLSALIGSLIACCIS
jgi:hypothetical protein